MADASKRTVADGADPEQPTKHDWSNWRKAEKAPDPTVCGWPIVYPLFLLLVFQNSSVTLMMGYTRATATENTYLSSTAVLSCEFVKFFVCMMITLYEEGSLKSAYENTTELLKTGVPALFYLLQNNLMFFALGSIDAGTFNVIYQSKIGMVAVLSVLMLGRKLKCSQWTALVVLFLGVVITQKSKDSAHPDKKTEHKWMVGFCALLAACFCSSLAGVSFELLLKGRKLSLWVRNMQLAGLTAIIGVVGLLVTGQMKTVQDDGFFHGYTKYTVLVVALNALGGLTVSSLIKYADNIVKNFAVACGMVVTCIGSAYVEHTHYSPLFGAGVSLVAVACGLYSKAPDFKMTNESTAKVTTAAEVPSTEEKQGLLPK